MSRPAGQGQVQAVEVEGLTKRFGGRLAVDGVSFSVRSGEVFGLLGPNGAGKTTIMRIISTLTPPDGGSASILGYDVVRHSRRVRQGIGLVFQEPSLDHRMTAYENLYLHGLLYGMGLRDLKGRIGEALEFVGLQDRARSLVRTFSGGMRRRLELARAFLHRPDILILDEPTVGLDPQSRRAIWDYIFHLRARDRVTVFVTTHYMDEAEKCDRVAIIDGGRVVAMGSPSELKTRVRAEMADRGEIVERAERVERGPLTLEDVFVNITGRELRDSGSEQQSFVRMKGRR